MDRGDLPGRRSERNVMTTMLDDSWSSTLIKTEKLCDVCRAHDGGVEVGER